MNVYDTGRSTDAAWLTGGGQVGAATTVAATARASKAAAITVSATGAATEVVHSGGGCTSGSGPFVRMSEHPGLGMRMSVASAIRSTEFTMPLPRPTLASLSTPRARSSLTPHLTGVAMKPCHTLFGSTESKEKPEN
jgi:hypothetical protein